MRKGAGITLDRKKLQETGLTLLITVIALLAALLVGALVIWAFGSNPIEAYGALWQGFIRVLHGILIFLIPGNHSRNFENLSAHIICIVPVDIAKHIVEIRV